MLPITQETLLKSIQLAASELGIKHVRSSSTEQVISSYSNFWSYETEDGSYRPVQKFQMRVLMDANASAGANMAKLVEAIRVLNEVNNKTIGHSFPEETPLVMIFCNAQVHPVTITVLGRDNRECYLTADIGFYGSDCNRYKLDNGEWLYPRPIIELEERNRFGNFFDDLLPKLREGVRIRRASWAEGSYILFVPGSPKLTVDAGRPLARAGVPVGTEFSYSDHIDLFEQTASGNTFSAWSPSQQDILATDWQALK